MGFGEQAFRIAICPQRTPTDIEQMMSNWFGPRDSASPDRNSFLIAHSPQFGFP